MKNYFASGKIYESTKNGQVMMGHFSVTIGHGNEPITTSLDAVRDSVAYSYKCKKSQIHIEQFNEI